MPSHKRQHGYAIAGVRDMLCLPSANCLDTAMNRNDLRRVDMNLLVIFEALMFEKT